MPLLESLIREEKFRGAVAFRVDFDRQKKFLFAHRVRWQSTVIVFKGGKEVDRSVADLNKARLRSLLRKGL